MCGIAGFATLDCSASTATLLANAMAEAMHHRGPDGGGVTTTPDATLTMKRLAIVDLAGGQQPMENDDASVAIVFNGEIYNAPALRRELEASGVRFRTRSDTEVLLRLYEQDPDRMEDPLVGMWAFAIHDRRRRRLRLSRDRFGIKPLFLAQGGRALAFASDLRCFRPLHALDAFSSTFAVDPEFAHAMVAWSYVPHEATPFRGVRRLAPGTRLELDLAAGTQRASTYWALRPSREAARVTSLNEACDVIDPLLRRAVREHLESDVPVASFLSGGIDSSLITAYAAEESGAPVEAYSIGFREPSMDESTHAQATARVLGTTLTVTYLTAELACNAVADALLAYDEPFGDSSCVATYLLARSVAQRHKVALGGDGGDEVFAGYRKHRILAARATLDTVAGARSLVGQALGTLPVRADRSGRWVNTIRTLHRTARGLQGSDAEGYTALTQVASFYATAPLVRQVASPERWIHPMVQRFNAGTGTALQRTLACDLNGPLPNDMLTKVDRATMACSLEARVPFLDHRLVEAGVGLPAEFTLGSRGKAVLRALHERRFGAPLAKRKKQGFNVPIEAWVRGPLASVCDELFATSRLDRYGLLSSTALGNGHWRSWASKQPQLLWHALALATWCEATLGDGEQSVRTMFRSSK